MFKYGQLMKWAMITDDFYQLIMVFINRWKQIYKVSIIRQLFIILGNHLIPQSGKSVRRCVVAVGV